MLHRTSAATAAYAQAWWNTRRDALEQGQNGQGTVEYVGIVVTMALLLGGIAVASKGWGNDIATSLRGILKGAITHAGKGI